MTHIYLIDPAGALDGPVELPVTPGFGIQIPANGVSLADQLPDAAPGFAWSIVAGEPAQLRDLRGPVYNTIDGTTTQHDQLGDLPDSLTTLPRPGPTFTWKAGEWIPDLTALYADHLQAINSACEAAIVAGFASQALGATFTYDSQLEDQLNLNGVILSGGDQQYPCRDDQGLKEFRLHTHAQLMQVGNDFTLTKMTLLQTANVLKQRLDAALASEDAEAMAAVVWESGL